MTISKAGLDQLRTDRAAISPANGDGRHDEVTATVHVVRAGRLTWRVQKSGRVLGARNVDVTPGQTASFSWNGEDDGAPAASGVYEIAASLARAGCDPHTLTASVRVDNGGPVASLYREYAVFNPVADEVGSYRDRVRIEARRLSENATAYLWIYGPGAAAPTQRISLGRFAAGDTVAYAWAGRDGSGRRYPKGKYRVRFRLIDAVGNERLTKFLAIEISDRRVVRRRADVVVTGDTYAESATEGCGSLSRGASSYPRGVYLRAADCFNDAYIWDVVVLSYDVRLPSNTVVESIAMGVTGRSSRYDKLFGLVYDARIADWRSVGSVAGGGSATRWFSGRASGGDRSARVAQVGLVLFDPRDSDDVVYDVGEVHVRVTYGVLV